MFIDYYFVRLGGEFCRFFSFTAFVLYRNKYEVLFSFCESTLADFFSMLFLLQEAATSYAGKSVKLGTCFAALLEGSGETWPEAFSGGAAWELVNVLRPPLD